MNFGGPVEMEEMSSLARKTQELAIAAATEEQSEGEALRTAILVYGYILLVPGIVLLGVSALTMMSLQDRESSDFQTFKWIFHITLMIGLAISAGSGYLLVRVARKKLVYHVRNLLYPALTIIGVYMIIMAVLAVAGSAAPYIAFGKISAVSIAISSLYQLPYVIGGVLLTMIGIKRFPRR
ncbi:MAG: hypothetical protein JSU93_00880 [Methanobacteriota archaeon]|nr:MAG: hypothetical protein JSU93_00880 [Euryarchaeota archaeon]